MATQPPKFQVGDEVTVHNHAQEIFMIAEVNPCGEPLPHQSHAYYYQDAGGDIYRGVGRGFYEGVFTHAKR